MTMKPLSRRRFLALGVSASACISQAAAAGLGRGADALSAEVPAADVQRQLLELAARQETTRRERFAAVKSSAELSVLQISLRESFLNLIGGLPVIDGPPPVKKTGWIEAEDYVIEKLVFESFPGYYVSALLYKPKRISRPLPGILSPCGHSMNGKADGTYQILHANLARRGFVVLTYDPVGQAERSQFWDAQESASRFNLGCGEHAVLGNPLYLLGSSLARFRIWDGMRSLDYLASLPEVDAKKLGCVGVSGGGTLTAYISALDSRVVAAAPCCYITTLPRRMANRIQVDPEADPEQDIFGFVSEGIDHAGLLALRAPRPTLLGTARFDFFSIEGARESFAEAQHLYEVAGAGERIERVEAAERHGMTSPLRKAVYGFFGRWLGERSDPPTEEFSMTPRWASELLVCTDGQVNVTFHSRPLLPLALEEFQRRKKPPRTPLRDLLRLDPDQASPNIAEIAAGNRNPRATLVLINGNESPDWREEKEFLHALSQEHRLIIVDPRGAGKSRVNLTVRGRDYANPLSGVEENIAYNAFLVGKSLVGIRVTDVLAVVEPRLKKTPSEHIILCGRRDAALVACMAAAVEPRVAAVAMQEMLLSFLPLFAAEGRAVNAASILPDLLERYGDIDEVLAQIAPRKVLLSAGIDELPRGMPSVTIIKDRFSTDPNRLASWMRD
jgi:dienelactone hydrolase/pimeloyl-ACP methyl ester carboxylesterase